MKYKCQPNSNKFYNLMNKVHRLLWRKMEIQQKGKFTHKYPHSRTCQYDKRDKYQLHFHKFYNQKNITSKSL